MHTLPLKFPRFWVSLGWFFVLLALLVCLWPPDSVPGIASINDKAMHASGYTALTAWFSGVYPRSRYWFIALALTLMGIGVELLQGWMALGREADLKDIFANVIGIAIGILLALTFIGGWMQRVERWISRK